MAFMLTLGRLIRPRWVRWGVFTAGLLIGAIGAFYGLLYTNWFQDYARRRVIAEVESATGGKVEIERFRFDPDRLFVRVEGLVVSASEPSSAPPFLTVAAVELQLGIESLWAREVSLRSMKVESPQVRVVAGPDDTTNLPAFPTGRAGSGLFELAVGTLDLSEGSLQWNDSHYPISFSSEQFQLHTRYEPAEDRYRARLRLGESAFEVLDDHPGVSEGEAEFFLYRDRIEAPEIYLAGSGARIRAELAIERPDQPRGVLKYQSTVALGEWAHRMGLTLIQSGEARAAGEARWDAGTGEFSLKGDIRFGEVIVAGAGTEPLSLTAEYQGDADRLRIHNIEARGLEGTLTGETAVEGLRSGKPRFQFDGVLDEFPLEPVLAGLTSARPQVGRLPYSGTLHGSVQVKGSDWSDLEAAVGLIVSRPARVSAGRRGLEGAVDLVYAASAEGFSLVQLDLATPTSRLELQGSMNRAYETSLQVSARFQDLQDVSAVARAAGMTVEGVPMEIRGGIGIDGAVSGRVLPGTPSLSFSGWLEATDFDIAHYSVKRLQGDIEIGPNRLDLRRLVIEDKAGSAQLTFGASLRAGGLGGVGPAAAVSGVEGDIQLNGLSVARLLEAAGRTEPLTGKAHGQVHFQGPPAALTASAELEVRDGTAWGEPFDHLRAEVEFKEERLSVDSSELVHGTARIDARGALHTGEGRYEFDLRGDHWRLEDLQALAESDKRVAGNLELALQGSGRMGPTQNLFEELLVEGSLDLRDLEVDEQEVGSFSAKVETANQRVNLSWQGNLFSGAINGRTEIRPSAGRPYQGECEIKKLDVVHLGRLADIEIQKMSGEVDAKFRFSGELADSDTLLAEGEVTRLEVSYSEVPGANRGYELWNPFPMRWGISGGKLDFDQVRLLGDGTDLVMDGTVGLDGGFGQRNDSFDLSLEGIFNLAVLESFRAGLEAAGSSELQATLRGRAGEPIIRGRMNLKDGTLRYIGFSNGLSQVNGTLSFNERLVRVEELSAASGGGTLGLAGTVLYGAEQWDYRLRVDIERVRIRYPESLGSVVDGQLTYSGSDLRSLLSGNVMISRVTVGSGVSLGDVIASLAEPTQTPASNPALVNMQLNVQIGSVPDLLIETPTVKNVEAHVDLRLAGTAVQPSLLGDIKVPQGDLLFSGSSYTINRGVIEFYNPFRAEPVVNFELETRVRDVDIALTLSGPASRINLSYRSDPPLRFDELVALIAFSRSPTTDPVLAARETVEGHAYTQSGANTIFSNILSRPGSNRLQRFFGVSRLKVDPRAGGAEANPSARVTTEQQVTKDLTFTYSYDLSSAQQQVIRVEWAPTRQWSFIVTRDENGLVGADVLFKKRLR